MVAREAHHLYHDLESAVGEQGMTMDDYLGALDKTPEEVEEELKPRAELVVKRRLVLDAIVVKEGLEVTDGEVRERIKADAETLGRDPNQLVLDIYAAGRQDLIRDELLMAKAVGVVAEHATAVPFTGDGGQAEADGGDAAAPAAED
jgi:FKBP-type peptidyl-prolyl cis-trans isomerase (trigger factor)